MKNNFLQSMLSVAREGTIAVALSVTMLSASVAMAAPPPAPATSHSTGVGPIANDGSLTGHKWSDALFNGLVKATLWTVGAPFPEHMSKGERIARYGAAIGLAVAGGVLVNAALIVTAPAWATGLAVAAGVGLVATGLHFGFGAFLADHFGNDSTPASGTPVVVNGPDPSAGGSSSTGSNTGRTNPTTPISPIPRTPHFPGNGSGIHR